ncbi:hypothetical protein [Ramlibacter sp.]|uniref:hypothetical protein n=1 Tax=Ramlibacter sp. TaxID=1917967 RepID=UPI003D0FFE91
MSQPTPLVTKQPTRSLPQRTRRVRPTVVSAPAKEATRIDASHLQRYCFTSNDEVLEDLTSVLSAVRTADRSVVRHYVNGWARSLAVSAPVSDLKLWRSPEVSRALADTLGFVTADRWSFGFTYRKPSKSGPRQDHLVQPPQQSRVFMPFSNGLDSFAIAKLLQAESASLELVLVNVRAKDKPTKWSNLGRKKKLDFQTVEVAAYTPEPHRAELSFRSRPFLYDLLAAYGAAIAQPARVVIPENGQGSLGGSLVPLGAEAPHRSCHPGFTARVANLIRLLTKTEVTFDHPALFLTKGQVLAGLAKNDTNVAVWLATHRSCSYDARHASSGKKVMHCGVCGNCVLRRVSLQAASVIDSTTYRASNLSATTFEKAFPAGVPHNFKANRDLALNSVRSMQRLADLATQPRAVRVEAEIAALTRGLNEPIKDVREKMDAFLSQHRREWLPFVESCGRKSWIADFAGN